MQNWPVVELQLESLAYGGEAFGRLPDGRAAFISLALPGERVRARVVEEKTGFVRAELEQVLIPSAERVAPRCVHFGACGGCHYQHMPYEAQLQAKQAILHEQLTRIGGLVDPPVQPVVGGEPWQYRNHVQFHLDGQGHLGYMPRRSGLPFAIRECYLPEPALSQAWPQLEFDAQAGIQRVGLRLGAGEDVQLILEGDEQNLPEVSVEELPFSVVHLSHTGAVVLAGSDFVVMEVLGRVFRVSAGSFFQVNTAIAEKMVTRVLELVAPVAADTVLELYSGVGLFSAVLAPHVLRLAAVESSEPACTDFEVNLEEFDNVELYQAPVELALPAISIQPQAVLVDPPRAGLERRVIDRLVELAAPRLVYVSCDPATLARDARRLERGGYKLRSVTPYDMFPQTYHIESISLWEKAG